MWMPSRRARTAAGRSVASWNSHREVPWSPRAAWPRRVATSSRTRPASGSGSTMGSRPSCSRTWSSPRWTWSRGEAADSRGPLGVEQHQQPGDTVLGFEGVVVEQPARACCQRVSVSMTRFGPSHLTAGKSRRVSLWLRAQRTKWPASRRWFAPESAIRIRLVIRQHPLGLLTQGGASDHVRFEPWQRPAGPARQAVLDPAAEVRDLAAAGPPGDHHRRGRRPVGGGPLDHHAAARGRQAGRAGRAGGVPAGDALQGARPRTRPGQGGGGADGRGAQGAGCQAAAGGGKRALGLGTVRAYRWLGRRAADELADRRPGGSPLHGLLPDEIAEIVWLFHQWGEVDRSHRKLAHRGSYLERVWVSPSSVRRVLAAEGLRLRPLP